MRRTLTRTLPSRMEQRRKLPMARMGMIAYKTGKSLGIIDWGHSHNYWLESFST